MFERECRALSLEVRRRRSTGAFVPGAWFGEEHLLLATRGTLLVVRPWGEGAGCEWLPSPRAGEPWRPAAPELDLAERVIADHPRGDREAGPLQRARVRTRRRRRCDARQLALPLVGGDRPSPRHQRRAAVVRFFDAIPERPLQLATSADLPCQWQLLQLLNRGGAAAVELCESTPALGVLLTLAPALVPRTPQAPVEELVQTRQRRLLEQLGFPGSRQALRVLRKIEPGELDVGSALALQRLCRDEAALARLSHLPSITRALLSVARTPERFALLERDVQLVLLDEDPGRRQRLADKLEAILVGVEQARRDGFPLPASLRSADHVRRVRGELRRLRGDVHRASAFDSLPPPPLPGIPGQIEPLRDVGDLDREGREMRNCVRSYRSSAAEGRVAIYRVLQPERATLSIVPARRGWKLEELKGPGNARVRPETAQAVGDWLRLWARSGA